MLLSLWHGPSEPLSHGLLIYLVLTKVVIYSLWESRLEVTILVGRLMELAGDVARRHEGFLAVL